jgi:ABC-type xylose transport system permease subunit
MQGTITARTFDYFGGLLVTASIVALCSGVLATLCVKYELRRVAWFWAAAFFACALVGAYCCLVKLL